MGMATRSITVADILAGLSENGNKLINPPIFKWDAINKDFADIVGTWSISNTNTLWSGDYLTNGSPAINQHAAIGSFYVPVAGTYTLVLIGETAPSMGIHHFIVNGSDVAQIDGYSASQVLNTIQTVSLGTLTVGAKILSIKMASKHASSTGYLAIAQSIYIYKT